MRTHQCSRATEWRTKVAHGATVGIVADPPSAPERGERKFVQSKFGRPVRGWKFLFDALPTVSPWATFLRTSGALAVFVIFSAVGALAQTNALTDAQIEGRKIAQQYYNAQPGESVTNQAVLKVRDAQKKWTETPVRFQVSMDPARADWQARYETTGPNPTQLVVTREPNRPNRYQLSDAGKPVELNLAERSEAFAGSDFWIEDFGLEFLSWPEQTVVKKEFRNNCSTIVLESRNPHPATNGYSRVVSRIAEDSGGVMEAKTYDVAGKLLKEFQVKSLAKVNGKWVVELVLMDNVQTKSRTRLEFDLKK